MADKDRYQKMVAQFAQQNEMDVSDSERQWRCVKEEVLELRDAWEDLEPYLSDETPDEWLDPVGEEMADVLFTVHLLAHLLDIDMRDKYIIKSTYNLQKSGRRDETGKIVDDVEP